MNKVKVTIYGNEYTVSGDRNVEEIKAIAIGELGMTYAGEGQIVTIADNDQDYVHQVADLP